MTTYVCGHRNPDTDSIVAAIAYASLYNMLGELNRIKGSARSVSLQNLILADKLSNMRAIARDYAVKGDELWKIFHAPDPSDHEWHYRGLANSLRDLKDTFAFKEFESLINQIWKH